MDYDTVELLVGAVLVLLPVVALIVAGLWCLKAPAKRMPWFFFLGPVASLVYSWTAGSLALTVFPPPYSAYFAGGNGLDLRGVIIVLGAMAGGAAGIATSIVFCILNLMRQWRRSRSAASARSEVPQ